jgi:chromosome segregation protein
MVPLRAIVDFARDLENELTEAKRADDLHHVHTLLGSIIERVQGFIVHISKTREGGRDQSDIERGIHDLREDHAKLGSAIEEAKVTEEKLEGRYQTLKAEIEGKKDQSRESERALFEIMTKQTEVRARLERLDLRANEIDRAKEEFGRELREAAALIGIESTEYPNMRIVDDGGVDVTEEAIALETRSEQETRRRDLEKMKIRLEELGGSAAEDTMKEYKEVKERDDFLARELADLEKSTATLQGLINELEEKLNVEFQNGIEHISKEFGAFFELMFGGGSAKLLLVQEEKRRKQPGLLSLDEESESDDAEINDGEEGVDISVSLPNKKIRGLAMLSGGERALTSIALIFAMSQVNPPPFLILDETDAALDEANSRRYGDMIENLAKKSELIVITHNRETMSRAGILYGVTMGSDGISKLLSVKFEEAVAVAK